MLAWILLICFTLLALLNNAWWSIGSLLIAFWKTYLWYLYRSKPWRIAHFSIMRLHAGVAGYEGGLAEKENREPNFNNIAFNLVKAIYPEWNETQIKEFIETQFSKCSNFADEGLIKKRLLQTHANIAEDKINNYLDKIRGAFTQADSGMKLKMIIAGVIEEKFGSAERDAYLDNLLKGKAW